MQQELDIEKNIKYQEMKNNYCIWIMHPWFEILIFFEEFTEL